MKKEPREIVSLDRTSGSSSGFVGLFQQGMLLFVYRVNSRENGLPPCWQRGRGAWQQRNTSLKQHPPLYVPLFPIFIKKKILHVKTNNLSCSDFYKIFFSLCIPGLYLCCLRPSGLVLVLVCAISCLNKYCMSCRPLFDYQ